MFDSKSLLEYWNSTTERCGVILSSGQILELKNVHETPDNGFSFSSEVFESYSEVVATWHTHPNGHPNLSVEDYKSFLTQPKLFHYIVGSGIVWCFYVQEDRVLLYEDSDFPGVSEEAIP